MCSSLLPLLFPALVLAQSYSSTFEVDENPVSDGGMWLNGGTDGLDWSDLAVYGGAIHGTDNTGSYTDPTGVLTGTWSPDQEAEATVYSVNPTNSQYQEVELRLRSTITPHTCSGYEIFFRCLKTNEAYTQIVRWNGPVGSFDYLADLWGSQYGVTDGDVVKATIVGNVITAYINGEQRAQVTDNTFASGNPGIGFNYGCNGTYGDFGFKDYTARGSTTDIKEYLHPAPSSAVLPKGATLFRTSTCDLLGRTALGCADRTRLSRAIRLPYYHGNR